ncbi:MAG: aspartate aminotransferase family protein [Verrucomicrobia bacterium]|nr:MAG: aspartate aminotransferase family protein [Verrucomicrobiota bacterium]
MLPQVTLPIPGQKSQALARRLHAVESQNITYLDAEFPIFWKRAGGVNVWDVDDNRFLDFTSAFGVMSLGHDSPPIRHALEQQASELWHAMGDVHPSERKVELCEMLSKLTFERWGLGRAKTILCNSGSESIEAALKTALLYNGKPGVLSFTGGYHGLGYGALEIGGIPYFRKPFARQLGRFSMQLPYPFCYRCPFEVPDTFRLEGEHFPNCSNFCLKNLENQIEEAIATRNIGCILVEPIQARGGEVAPPLDFLVLLRRICNTHKILLILDEIYTGFNRTGRLFACEHNKVVPDMICLGKALTNGFPLSVCVGRSDIMDAWPPSTGEALHTSTFLGNPLGCAMAIASLRQHSDPQTAANVRKMGLLLRGALKESQHPAIGDVRGIGLMLGIEFINAQKAPDANLTNQLMKFALRKGLIFLAGSPAGNVLSFAPPFEISAKEIHFAVNCIQEYLISFAGSLS